MTACSPEMAKRVFPAGFAWSVIESKWPGFETAFLGFAPGRLTLQPDEFWGRLLINKFAISSGRPSATTRPPAEWSREIKLFI